MEDENEVVGSEATDEVVEEATEEAEEVTE